MHKERKYQKGISLFLAISLMTVLLGIVLGTCAILLSQFKVTAGMEDSVTALYAADTGIEKVLMDVIKNRLTPAARYPSSGYQDLTNGAKYVVQVYCCNTPQPSNCYYTMGATPPACPVFSAPAGTTCDAVYYCVKSRGFFGPSSNRLKTQRAIQVAL